MFEIAVSCLVITALFSYINTRFIGLPASIGVMLIALLFSLGLIGLNQLGFATHLLSQEQAFLRSIDFSEVLLQGMLSLLLFAGALHVDLNLLRDLRWQVGVLAVVGTAISTLIVGFGLYTLLPWLGLELPLIFCLLFGALISPTDPIAVLSLLKSAQAPANLRLTIAGESLFNDGVGVVLFVLLLGVLHSGQVPDVVTGITLLIQEAGGGLLLGGVLGWLAVYLLRSIDHYQTEVLITLALVLGGYELAQLLHVSGPLAMVMAGLLVGNPGRNWAMSDLSRQHIDAFWELLDEILNAVLFVLIGLEIVLIAYKPSWLLAGLLAIVITLLARWLVVGVPMIGLARWFRLPPQSWQVMTWGGLRGGISVALVLSLPAGPNRDFLLSLTYAVVLFSILVQGLTVKPLIQRTAENQSPDTSVG